MQSHYSKSYKNHRVKQDQYFNTGGRSQLKTSASKHRSKKVQLSKDSSPPQKDQMNMKIHSSLNVD